MLIVEGDVVARMAIAEKVRRQGFEVLEAATMEEAIIALGGRTPISLVVTDALAASALEALGWLVSSALPEQRTLMVCGGSASHEAEIIAECIRHRVGCAINPDADSGQLT